VLKLYCINFLKLSWLFIFFNMGNTASANHHCYNSYVHVCTFVLYVSVTHTSTHVADDGSINCNDVIKCSPYIDLKSILMVRTLKEQDILCKIRQCGGIAVPGWPNYNYSKSTRPSQGLFLELPCYDETTQSSLAWSTASRRQYFIVHQCYQEKWHNACWSDWSSYSEIYMNKIIMWLIESRYMCFMPIHFYSKRRVISTQRFIWQALENNNLFCIWIYITLYQND
jgi:hypothetical protein